MSCTGAGIARGHIYLKSKDTEKRSRTNTEGGSLNKGRGS